MTRSTIFGFGKVKKYEDAAEAFIKAGNSFKLGNQWQSAGDAFKKACECLMFTDSELDAVNNLVEAGNCYKKINPVDAIQTFMQAIGMYNDKGRFSQSARYYKEVAEIYESDNNPGSAMDAYQQVVCACHVHCFFKIANTECIFGMLIAHFAEVMG